MTNPTTSEVAIALNGFIDADADAEVAIAALCDFIRTRHTDDTGSCRQLLYRRRRAARDRCEASRPGHAPCASPTSR